MTATTKGKKSKDSPKAGKKAGRKVEPRKGPPPKSPFERGGMGVAPKE